jgi:PAS domain S-box-containing protein
VRFPAGPELYGECAPKMNSSLPNHTETVSQHELLDALPALILLERAGRIFFANAAARSLLGMAGQRWTERPVEDVVWGLFAGTAEPQTLLSDTEQSRPFHATLPSIEGGLVPIEGTYSVLNAALREAVIVAHPKRPESARKPQLMEDVLSSVPEALMIVHSSRVLYTNPAFTRMFGFSAEDADGADLCRQTVPDGRMHEHAMLERAVDEFGGAQIETVRLNKNGDSLDVAILAGPLKVDGANVGYVLSYREGRERLKCESCLQPSAEFDKTSEPV